MDKKIDEQLNNTASTHRLGNSTDSAQFSDGWDFSDLMSINIESHTKFWSSDTDIDVEMTRSTKNLCGSAKSILSSQLKPQMVAKQNLYKLIRARLDGKIKPDVYIRIGDETFMCHMMVLRSYSKYFMENSGKSEMQLPETMITPAVFRMTYEWMLADNPTLQRAGIVELFCAAKFLGVKNLVRQSGLFVKNESFREDTAFSLYLEARQCNLDWLKKFMMRRISKFFLQLVASKEFLDLTADEVSDLLGSDAVAVNTEVEILMSAVHWLNYNWEERKTDVVKVVKCVRFGLMPILYLGKLSIDAHCVRVERIIRHPNVETMIQDGIAYPTIQLMRARNFKLTWSDIPEYKPRQWIFDNGCCYHSYKNQLTYETFSRYLEKLQKMGKDYWRSFETAKSIASTLKKK